MCLAYFFSQINYDAVKSTGPRNRLNVKKDEFASLLNLETAIKVGYAENNYLSQKIEVAFIAEPTV